MQAGGFFVWGREDCVLPLRFLPPRFVDVPPDPCMILPSKPLELADFRKRGEEYRDNGLRIFNNTIV
jgi:hypothetical protein